MKEITLKYSGLKLKHLKFLTNLKADPSTKEMVEVVAGVMEVNKPLLYRIEYQALQSLYNRILQDLQALNNAELKPIIEVNGVKYRFIGESKKNVGWYIDADCIEYSPEISMAIYYLEKEAKNYSELDDNGYQKYDTYRRADAMKEAPLEHYVALANYLKKKYLMALKTLEIVEKIKIKLYERGLLQ